MNPVTEKQSGDTGGVSGLQEKQVGHIGGFSLRPINGEMPF